MDKLKNKSEFNICAAKLLIDKGYYAPSVHCAYYSCLQLVKVIVFSVLGQSIEHHSAKMSQQGGKSHKYIWDLIAKPIEERNDRFTERRISRLFYDLKAFRQESDYDNKEIDSLKGEKVYQKAQELRRFLNKTFYS